MKVAGDPEDTICPLTLAKNDSHEMCKGEECAAYDVIKEDLRTQREVVNKIQPIYKHEWRCTAINGAWKPFLTECV